MKLRKIDMQSCVEFLRQPLVTISKLKSTDGYDIPLSTIYNICRHERYSLKKLFDEFEKEYGKNIPD
jgi:hypothetical protein